MSTGDKRGNHHGVQIRWGRIMRRGAALAAAFVTLNPKRLRAAAVGADGTTVKMGLMTEGSNPGAATVLTHHVPTTRAMRQHGYFGTTSIFP